MEGEDDDRERVVVLDLRDLRGGRVTVRQSLRLNLRDPGRQEEQAERVAELTAHHAVQYEVDG